MLKMHKHLRITIIISSWADCIFKLSMFENLPYSNFRSFGQPAFLKLIMVCWWIWCKMQWFTCLNTFWLQLPELFQVWHRQAIERFGISIVKNVTLPNFKFFLKLNLIMVLWVKVSNLHAFSAFEHVWTYKHQFACNCLI